MLEFDPPDLYPEAATRPCRGEPGGECPIFRFLSSADRRPLADGDLIAAVDLGSNSFHLITARVTPHGFAVVDRQREMVRLAEGLSEDGSLSPEVEARALACLERFAGLLRDLPPGHVRVLGTNTLRRLRDSSDFLARAERCLNHVVEIISGIEEARLIYAGVANSLSDEGRQRLVVDIGGGSTECIIGRGREALELESLYMGCVSITRRFFADGRLGRKRMRKALLAAASEVEGIRARYRELGWERVIGTSGSIRAIARVTGTDRGQDGIIRRAALEDLVTRLIAAGEVEKLKFEGLGAARRPVFAGGVVVLMAIFEELGIEEMEVSDGALREGALYDLLGRRQHEDVREATVGAMARRYAVDMDQAARVEASLMSLYRQVAGDWGLAQGDDERLLRWAARLHEIGLDIAHAQHHRHGAYVLTHADMPGFSRQEQRVLAVLVRAQRRKFPQAELRDFHPDDQPLIHRMAVLLRLAVLFNRGRQARGIPAPAATAGKASLALKFPPGWLAEHALLATDLAREAEYLAPLPFHLHCE